MHEPACPNVVSVHRGRLPLRSRSGIVALVLVIVLGWGGAKGWTSISPDELNRRLNDSRQPLLILDVRGHGAYLEGTIAGALDASDSPVDFGLEGHDGDLALVLPDPSDARVLGAWAEQLEQSGYGVLVLEGSLDTWRQAELAVEIPETNFVRPGTVPFVIPRGLCEIRKPIHRFGEADVVQRITPATRPRPTARTTAVVPLNSGEP